MCHWFQAGPDTYLQLEFWEENEVQALSTLRAWQPPCISSMCRSESASSACASSAGPDQGGGQADCQSWPR